jgi:CheY-like chemotaxis protein
LIIEDNPDDCARIRRMLLSGSNQSYVFSEAHVGDAGVRAYREPANSPPDCVLLDYHLPDMDAPEVLAELQRIGIPSLPRGGFDQIGHSRRR